MSEKAYTGTTTQKLDKKKTYSFAIQSSEGADVTPPSKNKSPSLVEKGCKCFLF